MLQCKNITSCSVIKKSPVVPVSYLLSVWFTFSVFSRIILIRMWEIMRNNLSVCMVCITMDFITISHVWGRVCGRVYVKDVWNQSWLWEEMCHMMITLVPHEANLLSTICTWFLIRTECKWHRKDVQHNGLYNICPAIISKDRAKIPSFWF